MDERSVILIDLPEGRSVDTDFLENLGHTVVVCHGPPLRTLCPILAGEECPKVGSAHGVIFELDLERPQHRAILAAYQDMLPDDIPLRVSTTPELARRHAALLSGVQVWTHEPTIGELDGFSALVEASDRFREAERTA
ncbi:MAG: hypothetical protein WEA29_03460 [Acidimicrobiia bacterium]